MKTVENRKTGAPRSNTEKRELRHTYPLISRQLALLQGTEWGNTAWDSAGLTWAVRSTFAPLGQTPAAVVTYRGRRRRPGASEILQLPLQQVYARLGSDGCVRYDDIHNTHELGLVAFPGARGKILDASVPVDPFREPELRRKNEWANVALELLRQHRQFIAYDMPGADVPELPHVFAGFTKPGAAKIAGPAAKHAAAAAAGVSSDMSDTELQQLLRNTLPGGKTVLESMCVAPNTDCNPTALWLVRQEHLAFISQHVPLYEDFTALCGIEVFNPARLLALRRCISVSNPARLAAVQAGVSLNDLLTQLAQSESAGAGHTGRDNADITDELLTLLPAMRRVLGRLSASFSDDALVSALLYPRRPLEQLTPVSMHTDAEKLDFGFGFLATQYPHLLTRVTDADMLLAFENPYRPLYARNACTVQHIQLDAEGHARFDAQQLRRARLSMDCL